MPTREEWIAKRTAELREGSCELPNGCTLYWKTGDMGREYSSDEIGGGVAVWHTALVSSSTLLQAILQEEKNAHHEQYLTNAIHKQGPA